MLVEFLAKVLGLFLEEANVFLPVELAAKWYAEQKVLASLQLIADGGAPLRKSSMSIPCQFYFEVGARFLREHF